MEIEQLIKHDKTKKVLELASGHGANTVFLAKRNPDVQFFATDLSTKPKKKFYRLKNTTFEYGDFHNLEIYDNNQFDLIFIMEALCHSNDKSKVLKEMYRPLKIGGKVIIYDGYFGKDYNILSENQRTASKLTSVGMAVGKFEDIKKFEKDINLTAFDIIQSENLSNHILLTIKRFEKMASIFFRNKFIGNFLKSFLPDMFVRNSLSGYLMPILLKQEIAVYYKHILVKR